LKYISLWKTATYRYHSYLQTLIFQRLRSVAICSLLRLILPEVDHLGVWRSLAVVVLVCGAE